MDNVNKRIPDIARPLLPKRSEKEIDKLVKDLMTKMTLKEKIGQMYESGHESAAISGPEFDSSKTVLRIKEGMAGSILGMYDNVAIYNLQKCAVEQSRLGIPLLFCNDIIHGCRTAFPHNLAMSCSWNPRVIHDAASISAYEASHSGVNLTFSPMLDLVRDPRWGRVMESSGEDPYLASVLAKEYVNGYQGDLTSYDTVAACAKHFVGYGASLAGRDYNTVDFSRRTLFQYYLPAFQSAIDSNVKMIMTAFNVYEDVPITANKYLLKDVLRGQLGFKGTVISDYNSSMEIIKHKIASTEREVAKKCVEAGLEHEMLSTSYITYLEELVNNREIDAKLIDDACYHILALKYELGLFDNPYKNVYENFTDYWLSAKAKEKALNAAVESVVLLKNENSTLPLTLRTKIAFIGPFVDSKEVVGAWGGKANNNDCVTIKEALEEANHEFIYAKGCEIKSITEESLALAIKAASQSETIVLTLGEHQHMSGEANARACIEIPEAQIRLLEALAKLNKKIVLVLFTGRPLDLTKVVNQVDSLLCAWFLGTMSGKALVKLLYAEENPSGKLTMTFPYTVGQVPIFYNNLNTGRPENKVKFDHYTSRYLDIPSEPLYPFGFGLSYSKFEYSNFELSTKKMSNDEILKIKIDVKNVSKTMGKEIVELYIEANSFSVSRPNLELKRFEKISINPLETKTVCFEITADDLAYYNIDMIKKAESAEYNIYVGTSSINLLKETIVYEE